MQTRVAIAIGIFSVLFTVGVLVAQSADTQPADSQPSPQSIPTLINQLGDPDPIVREQANKSLWSIGRPAEPALREAAASEVPEISRRAKAILRDFTYGLYPDAPHEIFALLETYRNGDVPEKRIAIGSLASNLNGVSGLRVLMKLREEETDPNLKQMIAQVLAPREHDVAVLMLADGQAADVEQMLENSSLESPGAAQDYAALLLLEGKLPLKLAAINPQTISAQSAFLVTALARAAENPALARAAAEASGNAELLNAVLIEQSDWKGLATRLAADGGKMEPTERLGYLCAYYRLAGDENAYRKTLKQLPEQADRAPEDYLACSEDLFLNDAPKEALNVLLQHRDYLQASNFFASRLQFSEALELPKLADQHQPGDATRIKARTISTLQFLGHLDEAQKLLTEVVEENKSRGDFATWAGVVEGARQLGLNQKADEYAALALEKATPQDSVVGIFENLNLGDGVAASQWWQFFRQQFAQQSTIENLRKLHSIFEQTLSADDLEKLTEAARRYTVDLPAAEREPWQETVIDTLAAAARFDLAAKWVDRLEDSAADSAALIRAGDYRADRKDWPAAATDYQRAWEHDRTQAVALYLRGWALEQSGSAKDGAAAMELADRLPLGSEPGRYALYEAMVSHQLNDAARHELGLILHITRPQSWERNEALRRTAENLAAAGDYLNATTLWSQAFLPNLTANVSFVEPWANVVVPALINKTRALGFIKAGQIDQAVAAAKLTLNETPGDADALIELVNAFDQSSHKTEADALYQDQTAIYRKMIADYPNSGPLHNQLSWSQVMCHRELDDALANGKRAVELEPTSTASRDTLAEVYFARGEAGEAVKQMKRCIELEPRVERHRRQLERFAAAGGPTTKPD